MMYCKYMTNHVKYILVLESFPNRNMEGMFSGCGKGHAGLKSSRKKQCEINLYKMSFN